jgi:hypothetical protein
MPDVAIHEPGNFRFIPGGLFSLGVAALPGYELHRVRFLRPQPLEHGFLTVAAFLREQDRPLAALAACELRSPAPLARSDFVSFNRQYVELQTSLGFSGQSPYPIGRSNLAPLHHPPAEPLLFAFSYTTLAHRARSTATTDFVISGKPENIEESPGGIVAGTDISANGLKQKAAYVMQVLRQRVTSLGAEWASISGAQVYTVHSLESVIPSVFADSGLTDVGLTLFPSYPPVLGLEFEVDVRAVSCELLI